MNNIDRDKLLSSLKKKYRTASDNNVGIVAAVLHSIILEIHDGEFDVTPARRFKMDATGNLTPIED